MAKKEFTYKGLTIEQMKAQPEQQFVSLLTSRARRTLRRGYDKATQKFLGKISQPGNPAQAGKPARTHNRQVIVLPNMVGSTVGIYNGKEFVRIDLAPSMVGCRFGELVMTRKRVRHSSPGIGATRGSKYVSLR